MEREALKQASEAQSYAAACLLNQLSTKDKHAYAVEKLSASTVTIEEALAQPAQEQWNAALDEAAARIGEIKGFGQATQDSFAIYIKGLKK